MRRYDDPVEVRRGGDEEPEQFLWRGRLWKVRVVVARWIETGAWWQSAPARSVIGSEPESDSHAAARPGADLLAERELWRVEAGTGPGSGGVFDLAYDWSEGRWQLVGCLD